MTETAVTTFNFVEILDPFNPSDCTRHERAFRPGQSLAELFPSPVMARPFSYTLNGAVIDAEDLATVCPAPGDYVTQCPIPQGGNAKNVLRIVAMIALVTVAPQIGALMGPNMFGAGILGLSATAWTAITMVGGSMLINALLPPPKPPAIEAGKEESPTYGIDGAKNTSAEGIVVPVAYGQHRMGGNVLSNYVINDGPTQYLYMLLNAGEGPIAGISEDSIRVNDQPLSSYKDKETYVLTGESDQAPPRWFASTITPKSVGREVTDDWSIPVATDGPVDRLRLDLSAPNGIFEINDKGGLGHHKIDLAVQYRRAETSDPWIDMTSTLEVSSYEGVKLYNDEVVLDDYGNVVSRTPYKSGGVEYIRDNYIYGDQFMKRLVGRMVMVAHYGQGASLFMSGAQRNAVRRSLVTESLAEGRYEVRIRRLTPKDTSNDSKRSETIYLTDLVSMLDEKVGYVNTAALALKIRLSDQLNGLPKVTFVNGGRMIRVWNPTSRVWELKASANPAWIVMDILTNARYGGGAPMSRLDVPMFKDWAAWCDTQGLEFHGIFDTQSNVWDAANQVARCGRAQLLQVGTRYSVVVERAAQPTMLFSVANMIQGSFKETWLPLADRANEIEITFNDKDSDYEQRTIRVIDGAAVTAGRQPRKSSLQIMGLVDAKRAYEEAWLALNLNRFVLRTIEFSAPVEAVACSVGDVIMVQHDMTAWGDGGRFEAGCTTKDLNLDREVVMEYGKNYQILVHYDSIQRVSGTVYQVLGNTVLLNGFTGASDVRRLLVNGRDYEILSIEQVGSIYGVALADASGIVPGHAYSLHDTNVMMRRNVANTALPNGFVRTKTLTLPVRLAAAPTLFGKWTFGETNKVAKPFRIRQISGSHEYRRDISAVEYNASIYDPSGIIDSPNYSNLPNRKVKPVVIEGVSEEQILIGTVYQSLVTVSYRGDQPTYQDAEVFLSRNDGAFLSQGKDPCGMTVTSYEGEKLTFRIVAIDRSGNNQPVSTAAMVSYTSTGRTQLPDYVSGLKWAPGEAGLVVTWNRPKEEDWQLTELRLGPSWDHPDTKTVFKERLTRAELPWRTEVGIINLIARNITQSAKNTRDSVLAIDVKAPLAPTLASTTSAAGAVSLRWQDCTATQPLKRYRLRMGAKGKTWAQLEDAALVSGRSLSHTLAFAEPGEYVIWVRAEDMGDIAGPPTSIDVRVATVTVDGVTLTASSQVVRTDWLLENPAPALVFFQAIPTGRAAGMVPTWTTTPPVQLQGSGASRSLSYVDMAGHPSVTVKVAYTIDGAEVADMVTVVRVSDGTTGKAIVGYLTNEAGILPADSSGVVNASQFPYGGTFEVWDGSNNVTGTAKVSYSLVNKAGGEFNIKPTGEYAITSMSAALARATFRAVCGSMILTKTFVVTASLAGQRGENGLPGKNGARSARVSVYAWAVNLASLPSLIGTGTYTWATSAVAGLPEGWSTAPQTAPSAGMSLFEAFVNLSNTSVTPDDSINWGTAGVMLVSVAGPKGEKGDAGAGLPGVSARIAYAKAVGPNIGSGTMITDGKDSFPAVGAWGRGETWTATLPSIGATESVFISNGVYDPATDKTTWGSPYLATWKVGSLSALTANLGQITAGSLDIGGRFIVNSDGYLLARGAQILDENGNIILSTKSGSKTNLPAGWIQPDPNWLNSNVDYSQVQNRPADDTIRNNLVDLSFWKRMGSIPSSWVQNQEENILYSTAELGVNGPRGSSDVVWYAREVKGDAANGGGFDANGTLRLDPSKAYRFVIPIRKGVGGGGQAYWGPQFGSACTLNTTNREDNLYFAYRHRDFMLPDRWYLFVGYVFPYGSTNNSHAGAGIFDCATGQLVEGGVNANHSAGGVTGLRAYQYYAGAGSTQFFGRPMVNVMDGTEPPLREYFDSGAVLNSQMPADSGNRFPNSDMADGWEQLWRVRWNQTGQGIGTFQRTDRVWSNGAWMPPGVLGLTVNTAAQDGVIDFEISEQLPVVPGERYEWSVSVFTHRCHAGIGLTFVDANGNYIGSGTEASTGAVVEQPTSMYPTVGDARRLTIFASAPSNASRAVMYVRKGARVAGGDSWIWWFWPFFGKASADQKNPSAYSPGPLRSVRSLGYSGALDATRGATIGQDLFGQINGSNSYSLIAPGGIAADRIYATQLSAFTARIGELQTASSGQRVRIADNIIQVFGAGGAERVRISS